MSAKMKSMVAGVGRGGRQCYPAFDPDPMLASVGQSPAGAGRTPGSVK